MAQTHNFRSALNGFNREDVVHYIEYINSKNINRVNQLKSEIQSLKDEVAALKQQPAPAVDESEKDELIRQRDEALAQVAQLQAQLAAREEQPATAPAPSLPSAELEAYRRAERMERAAKERSEQMYRQAAAILSDATTQVDSTAEQFRIIADRVAGEIGQLQAAVEDSKRALQDAAATMYTIRPENTEE